MKLYPDSKIFILCPSNKATGGPESLHQLGSQLLSFGLEVYMRYNSKMDDPVHSFYKKYHVPYVFEVEDNPHNICVIPEVYTGFLGTVKNIQIALWWLSVDHYLNKIQKYLQGWRNAPFDKPKPRFFLFEKENEDVDHFVQSEYTRQFLRLNGITKFKIVETPMRQTFLSDHSKIDFSAKKNCVAFNPKKGFKTTQALINLAPDIDWRPIQNMTPAQVQECLAQTKVYIDFGPFPGRERIPREAALSGCVIMTGKLGAAANDVDINIPAEFKFDDGNLNPQQVIKKIREVFDNFEREFDKQKAFRDKELNARKNFVAQVAQAFGIEKFPSPYVALVQGVTDKSFQLAEQLFQNKDFVPKFIIDDAMASTTTSDELILRGQNRNYVSIGKNPIEIITRDDAKFLYQEGRIKIFAALEPTIKELDTWKNSFANLLIFNR